MLYTTIYSVKNSKTVKYKYLNSSSWTESLLWFLFLPSLLLPVLLSFFLLSSLLGLNSKQHITCYDKAIKRTREKPKMRHLPRRQPADWWAPFGRHGSHCSCRQHTWDAAAACWTLQYPGVAVVVLKHESEIAVVWLWIDQWCKQGKLFKTIL